MPVSNPSIPCLEEDGWQLDDGEVAHATHPDRYWIPPLTDRQALQPGFFAKLRFYIRVEDENGVLDDCGERMWVEVISRAGPWYLGLLANQPSCTKEIKPGMEVWFQPRHIIDIRGLEPQASQA